MAVGFSENPTENVVGVTRPGVVFMIVHHYGEPICGRFQTLSCKLILAKILSFTMLSKGANCSVQGKIYEVQIHRVLRHTTLFGNPFHTQKEEELGGCSGANDLICQMGDVKIGIEAKKAKTPDWMQCSIRYHADEKKWGIVKGVIPDLSKQIFNSILQKVVLFEGNIPPFLEKPMTHAELLYNSE